MTVKDSSTASGALIQQWDYTANTNTNDEWYLERVDASDWQTRTYTVGTDWLPTVWQIDTGSGNVPGPITGGAQCVDDSYECF